MVRSKNQTDHFHLSMKNKMTERNVLRNLLYKSFAFLKAETLLRIAKP